MAKPPNTSCALGNTTQRPRSVLQHGYGVECASVTPPAPIFKRGGNRNRADRISTSITLSQAQCFLAASDRATAIGKPFNRFTTILTDLMGIPDQNATKAIGAFIKLAHDWMRLKGERLVWAWVREHGARNGAHVHILLHVPPHLGGLFAARQPGWLRSMTRYRAGRATKAVRQIKGTVLTRRIGGSLGAFRSTPKAFTERLSGILAYVLKGALPHVLAILNIRQQHKPCGLVYGKRVGWWQDHSSKKP